MRARRRDVGRAPSAFSRWPLPVRPGLRQAARSLRRRPGFTAAVIATFALGIGANTAIFSLVDAVLLRPLPYANPDRLIRVWSANPRGIPRNAMSPPDFFDLREAAVRSGALQGLASFTFADSATLSAPEPERVSVASATADLFDLLGVTAQVGRGFGPADSQPAGPPVVVASDAAWSRLFDRDPAIVGRAVTLDGVVYTIAGVLPPTFALLAAQVDFWMPLGDSFRGRERGAHYLDVIGRLAPGVTVEGAAASLRTIAGQLESQYPSTNAGWSVTVAGLHDAVVGSVRRPLVVPLARSAACSSSPAPTSQPALARGASQTRARGPEALGAGRLRVIRQRLLESALIAVAGTASGLVLAELGLQAFRSAAAGRCAHGRRPPRRVLAATLAIAVVTGLLTGLVRRSRIARHGRPSPLARPARGGPGAARGGCWSSPKSR